VNSSGTYSQQDKSKQIGSNCIQVVQFFRGCTKMPTLFKECKGLKKNSSGSVLTLPPEVTSDIISQLTGFSVKLDSVRNSYTSSQRESSPPWEVLPMVIGIIQRFPHDT